MKYHSRSLNASNTSPALQCLRQMKAMVISELRCIDCAGYCKGWDNSGGVGRIPG